MFSITARKAALKAVSKESLVKCGSKAFSTELGSLHWSNYAMGPPDPIVGLNEAFAKDVSV